MHKPKRNQGKGGKRSKGGFDFPFHLGEPSKWLPKDGGADSRAGGKSFCAKMSLDKFAAKVHPAGAHAPGKAKYKGRPSLNYKEERRRGSKEY